MNVAFNKDVVKELHGVCALTGRHFEETYDEVLPSQESGSCDQRVVDTASPPRPHCWRNRSQEPAKDQFNTAHHFWTTCSNAKLTHPNFDLNDVQKRQNWYILILINYAPLPFQHGGQAVLQGPVRSWRGKHSHFRCKSFAYNSDKFISES